MQGGESICEFASVPPESGRDALRVCDSGYDYTDCSLSARTARLSSPTSWTMSACGPSQTKLKEALALLPLIVCGGCRRRTSDVVHPRPLAAADIAWAKRTQSSIDPSLNECPALNAGTGGAMGIEPLTIGTPPKPGPIPPMPGALESAGMLPPVVPSVRLSVVSANVWGGGLGSTNGPV